MLQGADTTLFLSEDRLRLVMRALTAIRRRYPELADIPVRWEESKHALYPQLQLRPPDTAPLVLILNSDAARPPGPDSRYWEARASRLGIPAIDSLNKRFGAASIIVSHWLGNATVILSFRGVPNVPALARVYARVPQVDFAWELPMGLGGGSYVQLLPRGRRLHFVFSRGDGDCPAGCYKRSWYYATYDTLTHSATLERTALDGTTWPEPIPWWDVPQGAGFSVYPIIDSVLSGTRHERWWYRRHAVRTIGELLWWENPRGGPAS